MIRPAEKLQSFVWALNMSNKMSNQKKSFEKVNNPVIIVVVSSRKPSKRNKKDTNLPHRLEDYGCLSEWDGNLLLFRLPTRTAFYFVAVFIECDHDRWKQWL